MIQETRTYTVPLRRKWQDKPPQRRAKTAVKAVKAFMNKHMKAPIDAVKVSDKLNEAIWAKGASNPPSKITVVAVAEDDVLRVMTEDQHVANSSESVADDSSDDTVDNETVDTNGEEDDELDSEEDKEEE